MFGIGAAELMVMMLTLGLSIGMAVAFLTATYCIVRKAVRDEMEAEPEESAHGELT